MKVICVLGVTCSGKTTYIKNLLETEYKDKKRPVTLHHGKFFRETLGPETFSGLSEPDAPEMTERWVRNMITHASEIAYFNDRDLIIDGFPRTVVQVDWLLLSSMVSIRSLPVEFRFIWPDEEILKERINKRIESDPDGLALLSRRIEIDATMVCKVFDFIKDQYSKKYEKLTIMEIEQ